jgi:hypothetical protein
MKYLCLISFAVFFVACSGSRLAQETRRAAADGQAKSLQDSSQVFRYRTFIKTQKAELSGILILKYLHNEWKGSLVNEFGIKSLDFIVRGKKCKLLNVIPFLDKWYIRRTIANDLLFFVLHNPQETSVKERSLQRLPDGSLRVMNSKHSIEYKFQLID